MTRCITTARLAATPVLLVASLALFSATSVPAHAPEASGGPAAPRNAPQATLVVTSGADTDDGACDAHCTLREAIRQANATAGPDRITFALPTQQAGQQVAILLTSPLPDITETVEIDGFTQPGAVAPNPRTGQGGVWLVNLVGAHAGASASGLVVRTEGARITGLSLKQFAQSAIEITGSATTVRGNTVLFNLIGIGPTSTVCSAASVTNGNGAGVTIAGGASANVVRGNFIGCNGTGVAVGTGARLNVVTENFVGLRLNSSGFPVPLGNTGSGVAISNGGTNRNEVSLNLIMYNVNGVNVTGGDTTAIARNNFAANTANGVRIAGDSAPVRNVRVRGNGFGLFDALPGFTSTARALGRNGRGVLIEEVSGVIVGGTSAADRNVLAYSTGPGIEITGPTAMGNRIIGNYIGTSAAGEGATNAGNWGGGVVIRSAPDNVIGGLMAGEGNVIADNEPEFATPSGPRAHGIAVIGASRTLIYGNRIGVSASGASEGQGNHGYGVYLERASGTKIGGIATALGSNEIANNRFGGIQIGASPSESVNLTNGNTVGFNRIYRNGDLAGNGLGIDLGGDGVTPNDAGDADTGPNRLANAPQITSVTLEAAGAVVSGTMPAEPSQTYTVRLYLNDAADPSGAGEGQTPLGPPITRQASSGGVLSFSTDPLPGVASGQFITATATDAQGNTGEFGNAFAVPAAPPALPPNAIVVNSSNDVNDGACNAQHCSLREAILAANARPNGSEPDLIAFRIPGSGPFRIAVRDQAGLKSLPEITDPVHIDGYTQPGSVAPDPDGQGGLPMIRLDGSAAGKEASSPDSTRAEDGLVITTKDSRVAGLAIYGFRFTAIRITGEGATGNVVQGNYLGLAPGQNTCQENRATSFQSGIWIDSGASKNVIGAVPLFGAGFSGTNVISCNLYGVSISNSSENLVLFNVIGTRPGASTLTNLGNSVYGISISGRGNEVRGNEIVYSKDANVYVSAGTPQTHLEGNAIGGAPTGIRISNVYILELGPPIDTRVLGNSIGYARFPIALFGRGEVEIPNNFGIIISGAQNSRIGGLAENEGNVIKGNRRHGILLSNASAGTPERPSTTSGNRIEGNLIMENGNAGVVLGGRTFNPSPEMAIAGNRIERNIIFGNGGLGIDIGDDGPDAIDRRDADDGPNRRINAPTLSHSYRAVGGTIFQGTMEGEPGKTYTLHFYGVVDPDPSGHGEGTLPLAVSFSVTTPGGVAGGTATFRTPPIPDLAEGGFVTATATDPDGNTSEFSANRPVQGGSGYIRVTHGAAGVEAYGGPINVDVAGPLVSQKRIATNLGYLRSSEYIEVPASPCGEVCRESDKYNIIVSLANGGTPLTSTRIEIRPGRTETVIVGNPPSGTWDDENGPPAVNIAPKYIATRPPDKPRAVAVPPSEAPSGAFRVAATRSTGPLADSSDVGLFVVHAVSDAPRLRLVVQETGIALADTLGFGEVSEMATVPPRRLRLELRRASDDSFIRSYEVDFAALSGQTVPFVIGGFLDPAGNMNGPGLALAVAGEAGPVSVGNESGSTGAPLPSSLDVRVAPNPARAAAVVHFDLPQPARTRLAVYDALGREVALLLDAGRAAGTHAVALDTGALPSGVYLLRLTADAGVRTASLVVIR